MEKSELGLSELFIKMYEVTINFLNDPCEANYNICFETLLNIASGLEMSKDDIFNSYYLKLGVNYNRQETNY